LFTPSAFTPNEDGFNDYFLPEGVYLNDQEFELSIYDRWGNLIYETNERFGAYIGWDGRANKGKNIAQQDVYVWVIRTKDLADEKRHQYIGHVTLVR